MMTQKPLICPDEYGPTDPTAGNGSKKPIIEMTMTSRAMPPETIESGHWHRRDAIRAAAEVLQEWNYHELLYLARWIYYGDSAQGRIPLDVPSEQPKS